MGALYTVTGLLCRFETRHVVLVAACVVSLCIFARDA
jgi:hypothetical protein